MNSRRRGYTMTKRALDTAETGSRIIAAAKALFLTLDYEDVTLQAIAARADITLQTVLRRFGSKEGLVMAVADAWGEEIRHSRTVATPGDLAEAVRVLVASYEEMGRMNWRMLRQEHRVPLLHQRLEGGRAMHRGWIEETFAPWLPRRGKDRERRVMRLYAATDLYTWKLLRLDFALPRAEVEQLILQTVAVIAQERR